MPDKWPLANGNWSTAANWNGGTLPVNGDDIYLDNRTITLDVDINLPASTLRTTARSGGTAGGRLSVASERSITLLEVVTGTTTVIMIDHAGLTSITGATCRGSLTASNAHAVSTNATSGFSLNLTNCTFVGGNGNTRHGLNIALNWTAITFTNCTATGGPGGNGISSNSTLTGNCVGTLHVKQVSGVTTLALAVNGGVWTLTGNVEHGFSAVTVAVTNTGVLTYTCLSQTFVGVWPSNSASGLWQFSGSAALCEVISPPITLPGAGYAAGALIRVTSASPVKVRYTGDVELGPISALNFACFFPSNQMTLEHVGILKGPTVATANSGVNVDFVIYTPFASTAKLVLDRVVIGDGGTLPCLPPFTKFETTSQLTVQTEAGTNHVIAATAALLDMPAQSNVRSGVSYNLGVLTGTCAVPPAGSVAFGVPVDATTGTAVLTGGTDWTADERTVIRTILGIPGSGTTPADPSSGILDVIRDNVGTINGKIIGTLAAGTHNPQSGDAFAIVNNGTHGNAALKSTVDSGFTNTNNLITALNNLSAKMNIFGAPLLEIPDSGTTVYAFTVVVRDDEDALVNLSSTPTITAANSAAVDRSANLSAVSNPSTGRYTFTYSVANTHAKESLRIAVSGNVSGSARYIEWIGAVVDYDTVTALQDVQTKVTNIQTRIPAALGPSGRMDSYVGAMANDVITSTVVASSAVTELQAGLATQASVDTKPTLAQIEGSTVLAKEATVSAVPTALLNTVVENGLTVAQCIRLANAVLHGAATGMSTSPVFKSLDGTKDRVVGTVASNNRTITSRDGS